MFLTNSGYPTSYYNWDSKDIRSKYRKDSLFFMSDFPINAQHKRKTLCFDEIHKIHKWKNILKQTYDQYHDEIDIIVTGNSRLELFRKSGDSLAGRYMTFRLYPILLSEFIPGQQERLNPSEEASVFIEKRLSKKNDSSKEALETLLTHSGFPEPLLKANTLFSKKWRETYSDALIHEDLRDLSRVIELDNIEKLLELLPSRIGSPLSINSLREEIEVSFSAVKNWLMHLDKLFYIFSITPYSKKVARSIKKEVKCYFYDWGLCNNASNRFENYVATELLTLCELWNNATASNYRLHYVRTRDGKETDFLLLKEEKPWLLIEVKLSNSEVSNHHIALAEKLGNIPFLQLTNCNIEPKRISKNGFVIPANRFF